MAETAASRGREVRRRLVQAARELVPKRGWAAVSTRTVAERAGVAPGLVHYHFAPLQALLAEAAVGALRDMVDGVRSARAKHAYLLAAVPRDNLRQVI